MGLLFIFVGRTKEGFIREGIEKYSALLRPHLPVEIREIKGTGGTEPSAAVDKEGASVLGRIHAADFLVALDERGKNPDSAAFAAQLGKIVDTGRRAVFVVGGPFGLSGEVKARSDWLLSLSRLTFTHEMARLILLEQVYRAVTIMKHKAYHY